MLDVEERPFSVLQRLHLDELSGSMKELYALLDNSSEPKIKNARPEQIRYAAISKKDLCYMLGIYVDKLQIMRYLDDKAREKSSGENQEPPVVSAAGAFIKTAKQQERPAAPLK